MRHYDRHGASIGWGSWRLRLMDPAYVVLHEEQVGRLYVVTTWCGGCVAFDSRHLFHSRVVRGTLIPGGLWGNSQGTVQLHQCYGTETEAQAGHLQLVLQNRAREQHTAMSHADVTESGSASQSPSASLSVSPSPSGGHDWLVSPSGPPAMSSPEPTYVQRVMRTRGPGAVVSRFLNRGAQPITHRDWERLRSLPTYVVVDRAMLQNGTEVETTWTGDGTQGGARLFCTVVRRTGALITTAWARTEQGARLQHRQQCAEWDTQFPFHAAPPTQAVRRRSTPQPAVEPGDRSIGVLDEDE